MTDSVVPTGQSTSLVTFTIKVEGQAIPQTIGVLSISVSKEINRIPAASLAIRDGSVVTQDFEVSNQDTFLPGKEIEILAGYHSEEETIFKGIIIKHGLRIRSNGSSMLLLDCRDQAVKLTIGQKNKYFIDKKDSEAIEEIIDAYGLEKDIEETTAQHKDLVQFGTTDWDFMLSRTEMNGKICLVDDGKITVKAPSLDGEPVLTLRFGASVIDFDAAIDARDQYQSVTAYAWDPASQELLEVAGTDPGIAGAGNIPPADLAAVVGPASFDLRHTGLVAEDELQAWADAQFLKKQLSKVRGRVGFMGSSGVKPGDLVVLEGVGERINGNVYVSGVRHEIGNGTWKTDVQFGLSPDWFMQAHPVSQLPAAGLLPAVQGLQIGIVSQLKEDPDGEDRILVKLPVISSSDPGIWARVACLDAGENRGTFFRPEVGDEVVVGFLNNDPRDPVVLGALNSSSKPAPLTATDDNPEKGYVSRSEMKLLFNDEKKAITVETPAGKKIVLDEDAGLLKLEDENGNKITMDSNGISIESSKKITLKTNDDIELQGKDIKNTAQASFKADGSAGLELTSSAIAKLKGSLVQIN